jgi:hypothetical protein
MQAQIDYAPHLVLPLPSETHGLVLRSDMYMKKFKTELNPYG